MGALGPAGSWRRPRRARCPCGVAGAANKTLMLLVASLQRLGRWLVHRLGRLSVLWAGVPPSSNPTRGQAGTMPTVSPTVLCRLEGQRQP